MIVYVHAQGCVHKYKGDDDDNHDDEHQVVFVPHYHLFLPCITLLHAIPSSITLLHANTTYYLLLFRLLVYHVGFPTNTPIIQQCAYG